MNSNNFLIKDLRVSFVSVKSFLNDYGNIPEEPLWIKNYDQYMKKFKETLPDTKKTDANKTQLTSPWLYPGRYGFWTKYLGIEPLTESQINAKIKRVWNNLAPFRINPRYQIEINENPKAENNTRLFLEFFIYPFASAAVFSAEYSLPEASGPDWDMASVQKKLFALRHEKDILEVDWGDGKEKQTLNLVSFFREAFSHLENNQMKEEMGGKAVIIPEGNKFPDLFSIATIVQGEGKKEDLICSNGNEIHKAVHALASLSSSNRNMGSPPSLQECSIPIKKRYESDLFYGLTRGRVIWFPTDFLDKEKRDMSNKKVPTLSCLHRNIMFASLQIDVMSKFVKILAAYRNQGKINNIPLFYRECGKNAVATLGRLYGKAKKTFTTASSYWQMDQNNYTDSINAIRGYFGMEPLSRNANPE